MGNETLAKLEAVVQKMLVNINELKADKKALQEQIEDKNTTIAELESKLAAVTSDQEDISSRVSSLISSIEEWEKNGGDNVSENSTKTDEIETEPDGFEVKQEAKLFEMGE